MESEIWGRERERGPPSHGGLDVSRARRRLLRSAVFVVLGGAEVQPRGLPVIDGTRNGRRRSRAAVVCVPVRR